MHQENQIVNLQVAEACARKDHFLAYNTALEQIAKSYQEQTQANTKQIHDLQKQRVQIQERFFPQLQKYHIKQQESIIRTLQCNQATEQLKQYLLHRGFSYDDYVQEELQKEEEMMLREANDPRANNTVREYETVTIEDVEDEEDDTSHPPQKKPRHAIDMHTN